MKTRTTQLPLIFLLLIFQLDLPGQSKNRIPGQLAVEHYTPYEGLPSFLPLKAIQDTKGFIWIGSYNGLIRFDGNRFRVFEPDEIDLGNNVVRGILEDMDGNILLKHGHHYIKRFNTKTEKFQTINHLFENEKEDPPWIQSILEDDLGNIWVALGQRGIRIIRKSSTLDSIIEVKSLIQKGGFRRYMALLQKEPNRDRIQLIKQGNNVRTEKTFTLDTIQKFVITYTGELARDGSWADVGWLENNQGDTLWFPSLKESFYGGGQYKNRTAVDSISLPAGEFTIHYKSNGSHSYGHFPREKPTFPSTWGIQLITINNKSVADKLLPPLHALKEVQQSGQWLSHRIVNTLYRDESGKILVGTHLGLDIFPPNWLSLKDELPLSVPIKHFQFKGNKDGSLSSVQIYRITSGANEEIWLTGQNLFSEEETRLTLEIFDPKTEGFKSIPHGVTNQRKQANVGFNFRLNDLVPDATGGIWLSASQNGLYHIPGSFIAQKKPSPLPPETFSYSFTDGGVDPQVLRLMKDANQNIWITTNSDGLYSLKARSGTSEYITLPTIPGEENIKPGILFGDSKNKLWIISKDLQYVFCYDPTSKSLETIAKPQSPSIRYYGWMIEDRQGSIWFGTRNGKIARYDKEQDEMSFYSIKCNFVVPYMEDQQGQIWVADDQANIYLFDPENQYFKPIPTYSNTSKLGRWDGISFIQQTAENTFWVGYLAGGIGKITRQSFNNQDTFLFTEFSPKYRCVSFTQDYKKRLWVGTYFHGLLQFDENNKVLQSYTTDNGLLNNAVHGLYVDQQNRMWIHTLGGMQLFDLERKEFIQAKFMRELPYGLGMGGTAMNDNGLMYAASNKGIHILRPDEIQIDQATPKMVLTNLLINNQKAPIDSSVLSSSITYTEAIQLKHFQNNIAIEYAGLHYEAPKEITYTYQMQGLTDDWTEVGKERITRFSKLPPGKYIFEVKAANPDGIWTETPARLSIQILPSWYWNNWSKLCYLLILVGTSISFYRFQLSSRLDAAEKERLAELDKVKTRLYHNITHEFRTPLTVILGMADKARHNPKDWFSEGLKMIKHSGQRLLQLVNQMLDLARLESGAMTATFTQGDVIPYLAYITQSFQAFATTKGVKLHFLPKERLVLMDYDQEKYLQILSNLISNAIKFSPAGGDVYVQTEQVSRDNKSFLNIDVKDTGKGIPENERSKIFERFHQIDNSNTRNQKGTGIGLALTQELVKLLKGEISLFSEMGRGSTFVVSLPIENVAPLAEKPDKEAISKAVSPFVLGDSSSQIAPISNSGDEDLPILLVIEDNLDLIAYLKACLPSSFQIEVAIDGQEGIEKALEIVPDIIISDVMMPKKDGLEVVETLKQDERTSHIPIILLTAKADIESKLEGLERGADAYLPKPFNEQELILRIKNFMTFLHQLRQRYSSHTLTPTEEKSIQIEDIFIQKVRKIIEQNLNDPDWRVPHLASALGLSRQQLFRKLKSLVGQPPSEFIRRMRLEQGKRLLETTDLNVSEIAFQVGYKELAYFSTAFKDLYGVPPTAIRK